MASERERDSGENYLVAVNDDDDEDDDTHKLYTRQCFFISAVSLKLFIKSIHQMTKIELKP